PSDRAKFELLRRVVSPAWFTNNALLKFVSFRLAAFTALRGTVPGSADAYVFYATSLALDDDYRSAYEFGQLAVSFAERSGNAAVESRVLLMFGGSVAAYRKPFSDCLPILNKSHSLGVESGDLEFASYALIDAIFVHYLLGTSLDYIHAKTLSALAFYRRSHFVTGTAYTLPFVQWVKALKGATLGVGRFEDGQFSEAAHLAEYADVGLGHATLYLLELEVRYLLGDFDGARDVAARAKSFVHAFRTIYLRTNVDFYAALLCCALMRRNPDPGSAQELAREAREHLKPLEIWAENAPANYQHKRDLALAELASVEDRPAEAQALFYAAIDSASRAGIVHQEALAHELFARFHRSRGSDGLAEMHLRAAVQSYWAWGASAKVASLVGEFPFFDLAPRRRLHSVPVAANTPPALEALALLKATETVAEGLDLEGLLEKLVTTCAEAAQAESVTVVLEEGPPAKTTLGLVSRAVMLDTGDVTLDDTPIRRAETVPVAIVEHVFRSREMLVLGDATREGRFTADPYIAKHDVRSVLAVPILRGDRALGVLYCENKLATDAFTEERSEILRLLSAHIAIALENSRLFEARKRSEQALRTLSEASAKLVETIDYAELLSNIGSTAVPALADWCIVDMTDDGLLHPVAWAHAEAACVHYVEELHKRYPVSVDSVQPQANVLRTGRSQLISELTDDRIARGARDERHLTLLRVLSPRSAMFCPLLARGRTTGVVTFVSSSERRRFDGVDLAVAEELARRMGLALENARLHRDLQATNRRSLFMTDAMRLLGSLDVEQALDGLAHLAVPFLGEGCAVDLVDETSRSESTNGRSGTPADRRTHRLAAVSRDKSLELPLAMAGAVPDGHPLAYERAGLPYLGVPLSIKGKLVGAMTFVGAPSRRYTPPEVELTEELARRAALAIENARLFRGAQEAIRARDEFLAIAAHEIRGPITSIHLAVQSLRAGRSSAHANLKLLELIEREDRRLALPIRSSPSSRSSCSLGSRTLGRKQRNSAPRSASSNL
ncbi:MAG TPA: GAF domain-containing protein, partial [Labilithrix sp.]|nr:GAF domain-containing protein [Labilithrix sp.]